MADFRVQGDKVTIYVSEQDIHRNCHLYKSHRAYLAKRFQEAGVEITRWHSTKDQVSGKDLPGLNYMRSDSEIVTIMEVTATIGVNARRIIGVR